MSFVIVSFLNYFTLFLAPLFIVIINIYRLSKTNKKINIISLISYWTFLTYLFFVGSWALVGYYFCHIFFLSFFLLTFFLIYKKRVCFDIKPLSFKTSPTILAFLFLINGILSSLAGAKIPNQAIELDFPLHNGLFYVGHGGSNLVTNHHHPVSAQKYALDILKLNAFGFRSSKVLPLKLSDFHIYHSVVYSPCDGIITKIVNDCEDQVIGPCCISPFCRVISIMSVRF